MLCVLMLGLWWCPAAAQQAVLRTAPLCVNYEFYAATTPGVIAIPAAPVEEQQQLWIIPGNLWPSDVTNLMVEGNSTTIDVGDMIVGSPDTLHYMDALREAVAALVTQADASVEYSDPENRSPNSPRIIRLPLARPVGLPTNNGHAQLLEIVGFAYFYIESIQGWHLIGRFVEIQPPLPRDTSPPTTGGVVSSASNASGWHRVGVMATLTATDGAGGSGVKQIAFTATGAQPIAATVVNGSSASMTLSAEGQTTISFAATDHAGNVEATKTLTVMIDKTPPTLTFGNRSPAANAAGWNRTVVEVPFTAADSHSGVVSVSPASPVHFASDGANQTQNVTVTDRAGNGATFTSLPVSIDTVPPTITGSRSPAPNSHGWNSAAVTVSFTCADALSGIASCTDATSINTEGTNQSVTGTATDQAGNTAAATVGGISIDRTAPTITYSGNAGRYTVDQTMNITCTAADRLSGIANSTAKNVTGPAYSFALGSNTFSAAATDKAGNEGRGSTTFTVRVTFEGLRTLTKRFVTSTPIENTLCAKLDDAEKAEAKGDAKAKQRAIDSYVALVTAQKGKALTAAQAETLVRLVRAV